MTDHVTVTIETGIAEVRLERPDKLNALDFAMLERLVAVGESLAADHGLRAIVLSGAGRAFSAGLDTKSFGLAKEDMPPVEARTHGIANLFQRAVTVWRDAPVPVIAALHGAALGAGLNVALAADFRYAAPGTKLALAEINWGLIPAMAGSLFLRGLVRDDVMRDLVYTGRTLLAEEALTLGLVTRIEADPRAAAFDAARAIATRNPDAIRAAKTLFRDNAPGDPAAMLLRESRLQAAILGGEGQQRVLAQRKRQPE